MKNTVKKTTGTIPAALALCVFMMVFNGGAQAQDGGGLRDFLNRMGGDGSGATVDNGATANAVPDAFYQDVTPEAGMAESGMQAATLPMNDTVPSAASAILDEEAIKAQIQARIGSIMNNVLSEEPANNDGFLTVEELDRLRREAQRAEATRSLREARFADIEAELEILRVLQMTLTELRMLEQKNAGDGMNPSNPASMAPQSPTETVDIEQLRAEWEAERAATAQDSSPVNQTLEAEQARIPRLVSLRGAGGRLEAEIESVNGVIQYVRPGDRIADGFVVESMDGKNVVIVATATNNRYALIPSGPMARTEAESRRPPAIAQDMSITGIPGMNF